jgi:hypothetical protein
MADPITGCRICAARLERARRESAVDIVYGAKIHRPDRIVTIFGADRP